MRFKFRFRGGGTEDIAAALNATQEETEQAISELEKKIKQLERRLDDGSDDNAIY